MTKTQIQRNKTFIKALRSGKYKQARRALRTKRGYCCLGVACEVFRKATGLGKWVLEDGAFEFRFEDQKEANYPARAVLCWLGWRGFNPTLVLSDTKVSAAALNDLNKKRFKYIANAFERTLKAGEL